MGVTIFISNINLLSKIKISNYSINDSKYRRIQLSIRGFNYIYWHLHSPNLTLHHGGVTIGILETT